VLHFELSGSRMYLRISTFSVYKYSMKPTVTLYRIFHTISPSRFGLNSSRIAEKIGLEFSIDQFHTVISLNCFIVLFPVVDFQFHVENFIFAILRDNRNNYTLL
jgi:hypothetical protein